MQKSPFVTIVGGGLAGSEAAWQVAERGIMVRLYEMRPVLTTGAHTSSNLAELVCSNSLGSTLPDRPSGVLKEELRVLHSLLLECAEITSLPAGSAMAVDRDRFSRLVTERLIAHPNIKVIRQELRLIPNGHVILASGPLTSSSLSLEIARFTGEDNLYFYDAIAPILEANSIDPNIAFRASRFNVGTDEGGDYLNCPFTMEEYESFTNALVNAERAPQRLFEHALDKGVNAGNPKYFEGCLPVEVIASRGSQSLAFGPMRPVGIHDPRTGRRPYAIIQLRREDMHGHLYNMVGFQTNLTYPEQKRIFRTIPGLEKAEFHRYGQMHRNTFIAAPKILLPTLQHRERADLLFAGQITGVEGYLGNIATGLLAGRNIVRVINGQPPLILPPDTMIGALCQYITQTDPKYFQPMKANFGILPALRTIKRLEKKERSRLYAARSKQVLDQYLQTIG